MWRDRPADHVPAGDIVGGRIDDTTACHRCEIVKYDSAAPANLAVRMNVNPLPDMYSTTGRNQGRVTVYPGIIADLNIRHPNDRAILGDVDILANAGEAKSAKLVGAIIPRIKWVLHLRRVRARFPFVQRLRCGGVGEPQ